MQYLPDDDYNVAVAAAATLVRFAPAMLSLKIEHSPWTGRIEPDDVKLALGLQPDIWPEHSRPEEEDRPESIRAKWQRKIKQ
jgi:hypothetical protein